MDEDKVRSDPGKPEDQRAARLKAALKANLARRKAQARLRDAVKKTDKEEG